MASTLWAGAAKLVRCAADGLEVIGEKRTTVLRNKTDKKIFLKSENPEITVLVKAGARKELQLKDLVNVSKVKIHLADYEKATSPLELGKFKEHSEMIFSIDEGTFRVHGKKRREAGSKNDSNRTATKVQIMEVKITNLRNKNEQKIPGPNQEPWKTILENQTKKTIFLKLQNCKIITIEKDGRKQVYSNELRSNQSVYLAGYKKADAQLKLEHFWKYGQIFFTKDRETLIVKGIERGIDGPYKDIKTANIVEAKTTDFCNDTNQKIIIKYPSNNRLEVGEGHTQQIDWHRLAAPQTVKIYMGDDEKAIPYELKVSKLKKYITVRIHQNGEKFKIYGYCRPTQGWENQLWRNDPNSQKLIKTLKY